MAKSQRLSMTQIRCVFRLLGEVREMGDSPPTWRRHMLRRLCELIDADLGHAGEAPIPCSPDTPRFLGIEIEGVTDLRRREIYHWLIHVRDHSSDPCRPAIAKLITGSFTRTRQQLAEDGQWYRRPDVDMWRSLGADNFVYSHQFMAHRSCIHLLSLNRAWGRRAFTQRERCLAALFHEELGRLWREQSLDPLARLSRREAQTLQLLQEGDHEKHVADRLGLSRHTIHDYIKTIYRKLNVSSQPELMAFLHRDRAFRAPRLSCDTKRESLTPRPPRSS